MVTHSTMRILHHTNSSECVTTFPCSLLRLNPNFQIKVSYNILQWSPQLAHILGFQKYDASNTEFNKTQDALYEPDLFFMYPKNLIIGCDVVDDTIFGGEHVKLLRLVTNNVHVDGDILSFDFLQNEYVDLNVKEFKSIKIGILDASGGPVKTHTSFPTRLQLMFSTV
jgi:hypothetical protein